LGLSLQFIIIEYSYRWNETTASLLAGAEMATQYSCRTFQLFY